MKKKIQLYQLPIFNLVHSSTSSENSLAIIEIGGQNQNTLLTHLNFSLVLVQMELNCCTSSQFLTADVEK